MEEITKIIEHEINDQVSKRITDFIIRISKDYKIPTKLLLRYLEEPVSQGKDPCCMGIKKDGKRCTRAPKTNGYCGFHKEQGKELKKPVQISNERRVHVTPVGTPKSGVIDMSLIRL